MGIFITLFSNLADWAAPLTSDYHSNNNSFYTSPVPVCARQGIGSVGPVEVGCNLGGSCLVKWGQEPDCHGLYGEMEQENEG